MSSRAADSTQQLRGPARPRVAYLMSRFPKLTETFILFEMLAVERQGLDVEIFPLLRERTKTMHPEAAPLVERARFQPFVSWAILRSHLRFVLTRPRAYFGALWALLRGTFGSLRFFVGALGLFPKTVHFAAEMQARGITHVHAHFASHPAAAAFVIRRLVGIPFSFTAHGSDLHRDRHMLREKVEEARFVVAISNYNREVILEECGRDFAAKILVIHCGVDTSVFRPVDRGIRGRSRRPFTIVCTGTLHEVKGQTHLIEACRLLAERDVDFRCELVGDGPDRKALAAQVDRAGLGDRVHFRGSRTRVEIARLLSHADVVAAPSVPTSNGRREGIPVALMEAAASGVAVVASRLSGIPELIQDGKQGLLVPPRDPEALADALQFLREDPQTRLLFGREGRSTVRNEFDLELNARTLARLFASGAGA